MKAFSIGFLVVFMLLFNSTALAETGTSSAYPALPADENPYFVIYQYATGDIYLTTFDKYNAALKDVIAGSKLKAEDGSRNFLNWREYKLADGSWVTTQGPLADTDIGAHWVVVFKESNMSIFDYNGNLYFQATSPVSGEETPIDETPIDETPDDGDDNSETTLTGLENALQNVEETPAEEVIQELLNSSTSSSGTTDSSDE